MTSGDSIEQTRGRGRPPLISRSSVVQASSELGLQDLSMSKVAASLGVATQSLYRHVTNREELVDLTVDHILGRWSPQSDRSAPLQDWLVHVGLSVFDFMLAHPGLAAQLQVISPGAPRAVLMLERALGMLTSRGIAEEQAFLLLSTVLNISVSEAIRTERTPKHEVERRAAIGYIREAVLELEPHEVPLLRSIAQTDRGTDDHDPLQFVLEAATMGMIQMLLSDDYLADSTTGDA